MNSGRKSFQFVDSHGQSRVADLTPAEALPRPSETLINNAVTRTIFITHQPSTSRNVVTIYKRVNPTTDVATPQVTNERPREGPSSFPFACSCCPNRFRNAFALLKHVRKNHPESKNQESSKPILKRKKPVKTYGKLARNSSISQLRSITAPSGRILLTLLKSNVGSSSHQPSESNLGEDTQIQVPLPASSEPELIGPQHDGSYRSYLCRYCPVRFTFRSHLYLHYKYHRRLEMAQQDRKTVCSICQRLFINRQSLMLHVRVKHPLKRDAIDLQSSYPHECRLCFKRFGERSELDVHWKASHRETRLLSCEDCSRNFRSSTELQLHRKSHDKTKIFECHLCHKPISTKSNLNRHLSLAHHIGRQKQNKATNNTSSVEFDPRDDEALRSNKIKCHLCNRLFESLAKLVEHRRLRHSSTNQVDQPWAYSCEKCGLRFAYPSQLAHHLKTAKGHSNPRNIPPVSMKPVREKPPEKGPILEKPTEEFAVDLSAVSKAELDAARERRERERATASNQVNFPRPPSSIMLGPDDDWMLPLLPTSRLFEDSSSRLDGVLAAAHADFSTLSATDLEILPVAASIPNEKAQVLKQPNGKFLCTGCTKSFGRSSEANRHIRKMHDEQATVFSCDRCDKVFKWRHSFVDHCRTHTGERPFACDYCEAAFSTSGNLTRHLRLQHDQM